MKSQKIYFIWICPEMKAFEWFTDVLKKNEQQEGILIFIDL